MRKITAFVSVVYCLLSVSVIHAAIGDINDDTSVDLTSAVSALQISSGIPLPVYKNADVTGDNKIGEKAIYLPRGISKELDVLRLKIRITTTLKLAFVGVESPECVIFFDKYTEGATAESLKVIETPGSMEISKTDSTKVVADFEVYVKDKVNQSMTLVVKSISGGQFDIELFDDSGLYPELIRKISHNTVGENLYQDIKLPRVKKPVIREIETDRKVFALFYPMFGTPAGATGKWRHWDPTLANFAAAHKPLVGYYDSADKATLERQVIEGTEAGLDAFALSWWGKNSYEDARTAEILPIARENNFKIFIYYETLEGTPTMSGKKSRIIDEFTHIYNNYGNHPAYFKVDEKPVIFVYSKVLDEIPMDVWEDILATLRENNIDFHINGDVTTEADTNNNKVFNLFDSVHTDGSDHGNDIRTELYFQVMSYKAYQKRQIVCGAVGTGWDDSGITEKSTVIDREGGKVYEESWQAVRPANVDWIIINSWNEFHEGTEIEPTVEYGRTYLQFTKQHAEKWKSGN